MTLTAIDKWHKTRVGYATFGIVELAIAYGFASLAIDTAHLWAYVLAIIFAYGGIRNLLRVFLKFKHEHKH